MNTVGEVIDQEEVQTLAPADSAHTAAQLMDRSNVSAVLVVDSDRLVGIVTERDLSRRIVALDRLASEVRLASIMTADPKAVAPQDSIASALECMHTLGVRHLPVLEGDQVVGVVSIRDLQSSVSRRVVAV